MSDRSPVTSEIEYELALLSRYYAVANQRRGRLLDRSAYIILGRLEVESPASLRMLAEAFRLDISTVNRQVSSLLKKGLVEQVADLDGGAARRFRPTALGLECLEADRALNEEGIELVLGAWGEADIRELRDCLVRFNRSVEQCEGAPWPRRDAGDDQSMSPVGGST
ncbi:MarR family transcriptional regulator [Rhodococcus sp. ABRD24]|nr:MarR family transcriptional regulator [Rhodococcus sp. ABRD24]